MLPAFKYHPDPIATGSVRRTDDACACCEKPRGFLYRGPVYGKAVSEVRGRLCPWCIADGTAAARYNCSYTSDYGLAKAGLQPQVVMEVTKRTPAFNSWQQQGWEVCCQDACAFYGDATLKELSALSGTTLANLQGRWPVLARNWAKFLASYVPGGGLAIYRFQCLHCSKPIYVPDPS
jgi:uncharacterized protein CbrC (UPF0167 family)